MNSIESKWKYGLLWVFLLSHLLIFPSAGCSRKKSARLERFQSAPKEMTIQQFACAADTSQKYSACLPDSSFNNSRLPAVFAFDPHADGALAVKLLAPAASKLGYLVIGSGNFRNGTANPEYIFDNLLADAKKRFPVDPERIYLVGFSGGARAAAGIGLSRPGIRGVVLAGAGLPGIDQVTLAQWPVIYCMAGNGDFNMNEVLGTDQALSAAKINHATRIFAGKHAWPPASEWEEALLFLELNAMKQKITPHDPRFIHWYYNRIDSIALQQLYNSQPVAAMDTWQGGMAALQGLMSVHSLQKKADELRQSDIFKQGIIQQNKLSQLEKNLQGEYARAFENQSPTWWRNEISALNAKCEEATEPGKLGMYNRLKGFLGIAAYSYTGQSLKIGDIRQAERLLSIYRLIEPENPDCIYFEALLMDKQGKPSLAAVKIKEAISKGFSDTGKINEDFSRSAIELLR